MNLSLTFALILGAVLGEIMYPLIAKHVFNYLKPWQKGLICSLLLCALILITQTAVK